jgi:AcrR family transcriptional regulator
VNNRLPSRVAARKPPTSRRRRRSPQDILNRITRAATEEFKRHGFAGATTAAIARRADVTEAQLYRYFGSKANLFREAIFKPLDQHFLQFFAAHAPKGPKGAYERDTTIRYITELQRFIAQHVEMLASLVIAQTYDPGAMQAVGRIANSLGTYFDHGTSLMQKGMARRPKVDPNLMVRVSFVAVLACIMFKDWIFPPGLASDEKIRAAINDFVMEGIGANFEKAVISLR